jgi:hypothetical protein
MSKNFIEFLLERQPDYDELILQKIKPSGRFSPLPQDIRLLPNQLRRVYCATEPMHKSANALRMSVNKLWEQKEIAEKLLIKRTRAKIAKLPSEERKYERWRRSSGWIGLVSLGEFPTR